MSIAKNLPAWCYCTSPRTGDVVIVTRGEKVMYQTKSEVVVATANRQLGVEPRQAGAMLGGALYGWDSPAADPDNYDLQGSYCGPVIKEDYI